MHRRLTKLIAFFLSVLILFGAFGGRIQMKTGFPITQLELADVDITEGVFVSIPQPEGTIRFNRISFSYQATAPVRAVFSYREAQKTREEDLLLSSKGRQAVLLLDGYLKKKTATRLCSVRFEPIVAGQQCTLSVSEFTCDLQTVPNKDVLYLENDRFIFGIKLLWGGGLCHFEDKENKTYGNLLNAHDTGRLVQQSFYGPTEIPGYENGYFNGSRWPYNPVQGGDLYGNASKLVALAQDENSIRVVSRPLDWAQNGQPTFTYYTSVYTLSDNGLTVENTAVDFLQTVWKPRDQEIPAFYTISALKNFVFYDGDKPWTGAPLREEKELPFWGGKPAFVLQEGNNENWCAWTDDSGYGVGLYSPAADRLLAGRHLFDGTADPNADPTNYVAPLGVFALRFDEPYRYTYYLTAGQTEAIRAQFQQTAAGSSTVS